MLTQDKDQITTLKNKIQQNESEQVTNRRNEELKRVNELAQMNAQTEQQMREINSLKKKINDFKQTVSTLQEDATDKENQMDQIFKRNKNFKNEINTLKLENQNLIGKFQKEESTLQTIQNRKLKKIYTGLKLTLKTLNQKCIG